MNVLSRAGSSAAVPAHTFLEDAQAVCTGSLLAALAIALFNSAGLVSGGTVGLALLLHGGADLDLSLALLLANTLNAVLAVNHRPGRYIAGA